MIKLTGGAVIEPVFNENAVPICFSANNSYVPQTAVMIKSIIGSAINSKNYDFIILSTDINSNNEETILGFAEGKKNISIRIFDISVLLDDVVFYTDSVYTPTTYSKEAYFRLFIPFAMPDYEKVIYFDGDMAAVSDVSPLIDLDLTGKLAAATRDYCGIAACYDTGSDRLEYRNEIGIKEPDNYFISSMVVVNIQEFRKHYALPDIKKIISSRNWRQHDQDIFNVLCQDALVIVDAKWSFFEEFEYSMQWLPENMKKELLSAKENAVVIHYASTNKAWVDDNSALTACFWKYASETPYFEEFYNKISIQNVSYRYHIFKNVLNKNIDYYYANDNLYLNSTPYYIGALSDLNVVIESLDIESDTVRIDGWFSAIDFLGDLRLFAKHNGIGQITYNSPEYRKHGNNSQVKNIRSFSVTINLNTNITENYVDFGFTYDDKHFFRPAYLAVEQFAPINEHPDSFYSRNGYILKKINGDCLKFEKHCRKKVYAYNKKLCKYLRNKNDKYFTKMAIMRNLYYASKPIMRNKNIWLISDKSEVVGAKTIEFFDYVKSTGKALPYFVVTADCKNIAELKKHGKVLMAKTKKHKLLFFHSRVVISNSYHMPFFMPAYDRANEIRDLVANKKFVLWTNDEKELKSNRKCWHNIFKFIISNKNIYEDMISSENGYTETHMLFCKDPEDNRLYKDIFDVINEG